jgi:hypothetical protein
MKRLNKALLTLMLAMPCVGMTQTATLEFQNTHPDVILQMNFNQYSKNFIIGRAREVIKELKGIDIFDHTMNLPKFDAYVHEKGVADYIVGDLGKHLSNMIQGSLKGAKTTVDVYDFNYKLGRPRAIIDLDKTSEDGLDFIVKLQMSSLRVSVDALYVNNHSPGVDVIRTIENGQSRTQIINPQLRTILDDVYLKLDNPEDRPMLIIDAGKGRRGHELSVISGEIKIRMVQDVDGSLKLQYRDFKVNLFGADTAEEFAPYIDLQVGPDTKIGGLESIEFGQANNRVRGHNLEKLLLDKKVLIAELLAQPIINAVFSDDVKEMVKSKVDGVVIRPNVKKEIPAVGLGFQTKINEIGVINPDRTKFDDQLRVAVDVDLFKLGQEDKAFNPPYAKVVTKNLSKSLEKIHSQIASDRNTFVISLDQDFINHGMSIFLKENEKELLEGNVPSYMHFGKHGGFVIFDDEAQGKLVLDLLAREKFFKRMLMAIGTGRSKYYFPGVLIPEFSIVNKNKIPHLVLRIKDIDITDETLMNGAYGLPSNLDRGWLKKLVTKYVRDEFKAAIGSVLQELPLPMLQGLNISDVLEIKSDGHGRLNIMMDLSPASPEGRKFTYQLPKVIGDIVKNSKKNKKS